MPELLPRERLLPCLLDRLTDDEPRQGREGRARRVVSLRQYVDAVRRDLRWLLNSSCHSNDESIYNYPEVASSVLNYGIPDLCGMTATGIDTDQLYEALRQAILTFEPRIQREGLSVQVIANVDEMSANAIGFEIESEVWAQPAPEFFYVKTEVDLESGQWEF